MIISISNIDLYTKIKMRKIMIVIKKNYEYFTIVKINNLYIVK